MPSKWTKSSDWVPKSHAIAVVKFWEWDLKLSEQYLKKVLTYSKYGFKFYNQILKIAEADVELSKRSLEEAKRKLKETEDRVGDDN